MEYKDYYQLLGVAKDATQKEIKIAYRKLARKYHPDVSSEADAEIKFKEMGEAYEVLKDPEKRAAYDQLGANYQAGQNFTPPPDWDAGFEFSGGGFTNENASRYSDFFENLFGRQFEADFHQQRGANFNHQRQTASQDHHAKIFIDLEDSYQGTTRSITLKVPDVDAQGHIITKDRTLNVRIPKGVRQGQKIRLAGQGSVGMSSSGISAGKAGDLYLEIEFNPHSIYKVEGSDVYLELPIAPWEAILGAKIKVPTPAADIDLTIPPESKSGRKLRLKGRGIPGKTPGDLYVVLRIALPPGDTEQARELYQKMKQQLDFNPREKLGV